MVNGINTQQIQGAQQFNKPDSAQMFQNLSQKVGADDTGITKDDLENYLKKLQDEGKGNSKEAKMISKMTQDFDKLSGGSDKITADSMKTGMESLRPQGGRPPKMNPTEMFNDLSQKVGADDTGITKNDLESYLKKLQDNGKSDSKEAELISKLVEDFDNAAGGTDKITASSLQKAFESKRQQSGYSEPQDPSTITPDQLQSPIDISV